MQELFVLGLGPLDLLDRWVEPFIPTRLALLGCFADEQRGDTSPLLLSQLCAQPGTHVLSILGDGSLQNLVLSVTPYTTLDDNAHLKMSARLHVCGHSP